jgi:hypothetical protein
MSMLLMTIVLHKPWEDGCEGKTPGELPIDVTRIRCEAIPYSRLVITGREAVDENLLNACEAVVREPNSSQTTSLVQQAARSWAARITLLPELRAFRDQYVEPLSRLIRNGKVVFYESLNQQGQDFSLALESLLRHIGPRAFGSQTQEIRTRLQQQLEPLLAQARQGEGQSRDESLRQMVQIVRGSVRSATTAQGQNALNETAQTLEGYMGSRGALDRRIATYPRQIVGYLNYQPPSGQYEPSLTLVIGEKESTITGFAQELVQQVFADRRNRSLLYPMISFIFDEANVFIGQQRNDPASVVDGATLLARRGRKFGLGLGIATQRIRYLDTSIMAQPHTYFISKLPRKTDREAIADSSAAS